MKEETGCEGCDFISNIEEDGEIFCKLVKAGKKTKNCANPKKPFIYVNGKKVLQPIE